VVELTPEQRLELMADAPRFIDPDTSTTYVLVKEEIYECLEALLVPDRLTAAEQRLVLHAAGMRARWDDPEMDIYDREDEACLKAALKLT
jgi:hypothetical protein